MESERRREQRYSFVAAAEVTVSESNVSLKARTSDLSSNGCYLDTVNPLPQGAVVTVHIKHGDRTFVAQGVVAHVQLNMGMGVTFIALESGCSALLESWLGETNLE